MQAQDDSLTEDLSKKLNRLVQIRNKIEKKEVDNLHDSFKKKVSLMKLDAIIDEIKETGNSNINYPPSRTIQVTHYFE